MVILDKHGNRKKRVVLKEEKDFAELDLVVARSRDAFFLFERDTPEWDTKESIHDLVAYRRVW